MLRLLMWFPLAEARSQLPHSYTREDVVFNIQRCALLPVLLGQKPLHAAKFSEAMRDRLHQPYRTNLVPGLGEVLVELRYDKYPGLLGTCLSSAGPSIIALAIQNFEIIAQAIIMILSRAQDVRYDRLVLELDPDGATWNDTDEDSYHPGEQIKARWMTTSSWFQGLMYYLLNMLRLLILKRDRGCLLDSGDLSGCLPFRLVFFVSSAIWTRRWDFC